MDVEKQRVLVVGCGGIGGVIAGALSRAGVADVAVLSTNPRINDVVRADGLGLTGTGGATERVLLDLREGLAVDDAPFDLILLATQPPDVEAAAGSLRSALAPGGAFVVLQNGLCEARVAAIAGPEAVLGCIVMWGASVTAPGEVLRTSDGGFVLGRLDGRDDARLHRLASLLSAVGPCEITADLAAARWAKLAVNCVISTLGTLGGDRVGPLLARRLVRRLALEIFTEVVAVARAEGVEPARLAGAVDLGWVSLTPAERAGRSGATLAAKHALLLAVGARYRNLRSSMLRALEQGRTPPVDFLNGEVVAAGRRHGIHTPINTACTAWVHQLADGTRQPSVDTVRALYASTREASVRVGTRESQSP